MKTRQWMLCAGACFAALALPVRAETVVIVNAQNANASLTAEQVQKIFMGKATSFPNGATAVPIDQPDNPEREAFYKAVTGKDSAQIKAYWSKLVFTGKGQPPKEAPSAKEVVSLVGKNPNLVGYVDKGLVNSSVKVVFSAP